MKVCKIKETKALSYLHNMHENVKTLMNTCDHFTRLEVDNQTGEIYGINGFPDFSNILKIRSQFVGAIGFSRGENILTTLKKYYGLDDYSYQIIREEESEWDFVVF